MEPIQPTQQFTVSLEAQEWQQALEILGNGPWRVANPLIQKISQQIQQMAEIHQAQTQAQAAANGQYTPAPNQGG